MRGRHPGRNLPYPGNYRVGVEPPWVERGSLFTTADTPQIPRTLRTSESLAPAMYAPGAQPITEENKKPIRIWEGTGLPANLIPLVKILEKLVAQLYRTREQPFRDWRVDTVALVNTGPIWLDQFGPQVAGTQRYMWNRRALIIVNQDNANAVWIRHTEQAVTTGGFIAASGSIMLPMDSRAKFFAQSVAATSSVSFYQFV